MPAFRINKINFKLALLLHVNLWYHPASPAQPGDLNPSLSNVQQTLFQAGATLVKVHCRMSYLASQSSDQGGSSTPPLPELTLRFPWGERPWPFLGRELTYLRWFQRLPIGSRRSLFLSRLLGEQPQRRRLRSRRQCAYRHRPNGAGQSSRGLACQAFPPRQPNGAPTWD